jgi:hypothetical protein
MSTESLESMTAKELRYERELAKANVRSLQLAMQGSPRDFRMKCESGIERNRLYIDKINARIARLERVGRN